jgi:hypothetical protein
MLYPLSYEGTRAGGTTGAHPHVRAVEALRIGGGVAVRRADARSAGRGA